jgi:nitroreductase
MMKAFELIQERRTIRKFQQKAIDRQILLDCINAARLAPSGANIQPLEYILVTERLDEVFSCTKWAGYLEDGGPKQGEKPMAYVIIISRKDLGGTIKYDTGLSAENLILTALERGIASCLLGALDRIKLREILSIPEDYEIELVVALGYPAQESRAEEMGDSVKYWLDGEGVLHVPKRKQDDVLHLEKY